MIDMLVLRCSIRTDIEVTYTSFGSPIFTDNNNFLDIRKLEIPLECSIDTDGMTHNLRHVWEKIPSHFSNLAFKVFDLRDAKDPAFYIEIKASPAKIMQGHNICGSDDLRACSLSLIEVLYQTYPTLSDYLEEGLKAWKVAHVDITYHSHAKNEHEADMFINALGLVRQGQTKARTGYSGTVYFGKKNSRIKKIKVYNKYKEIIEFMKSIERAGDPNNILAIYTEELKGWARGMVRWEVSLKSRWFQRRGISTNLVEMIKQFKPIDYWKEATSDLFTALEGEEMRILQDDKILDKLRAVFFTINSKTGNITYGKANAAYRTFRAIKTEGYDVVFNSETISRSSFYSHLSMLKDIGISRIVMQNLKGDGLGAEVIPFIRYVTVDFGNQFPPNYQEPEYIINLRIEDELQKKQQSKLKLVA